MSNDTQEKAIAAICGAAMAVISKVKLIIAGAYLFDMHLDYLQYVDMAAKGAIGALSGLIVKFIWDKTKKIINTKK